MALSTSQYRVTTTAAVANFIILLVIVFPPFLKSLSFSLVTRSVKNPPYNAGDLGSIPRWGRSWRGKWKPTPVFSPGKSPEQRSLAGHSPWGHKSRTELSD